MVMGQIVSGFGNPFAGVPLRWEAIGGFSAGPASGKQEERTGGYGSGQVREESSLH